MDERSPLVPAQTFDRSVISRGAGETRSLGGHLARFLQPGDVLALIGELGAGKTNFVKGLARGLGVREAVHSPTFILANEYRSGRMPLFHVDAYRVTSASEAIGFGLDDYLNEDGVTVIEWADRIRGALPADRLMIEFKHSGDQERTITFLPMGERARQLYEGFRAAGD